jgi:hypothetical protein
MAFTSPAGQQVRPHHDRTSGSGTNCQVIRGPIGDPKDSHINGLSLDPSARREYDRLQHLLFSLCLSRLENRAD